MSNDQDLQIPQDDTDIPGASDEQFELPPEALAEAEAAAAAPGAGYTVTRERLEELNADPALMQPDEFEHVKDYILEGKEWPAAKAITETVDEALEREANEAAAAVEEPPRTAAPDPEEDDDSLDARRGRIEAITTLKTEHKTEIAKLDAILDKPEPEDEFSDEHKAWEREQRTTQRAKDKLRDEYTDKLTDMTVAGEATSVAVQAAEKFMSQFDKVSTKHTEVKLDRPFKVGNAEYSAWLKRLVTESGITEGTDAEKREAAYSKFQNDPEFAKKVPAPKDLKQIQILNTARELVEAAGGKRTLEGAVLEVLNTRGLLGARETAAATAASRAAADKVQTALQRSQTAPRTAPINSSGGKAPRVLTAPVDIQSATDYLTNLLDKKAKRMTLTPFETKYEDAANALIGLDKVR